MKIIVVGTSNSVIGSNGFIKAMRLEHEVIQLSIGRTPFYASMKTILNHKDMIESGDLLIIDHYINDINFYGERLGCSYREHLELFYSYLSSLNVNILNLMFPIQDLDKRASLDLYHKTKSLCSRYSISVLDLNELGVPDSFYLDKIHLTHDVSYALGLSLNQSFSKLSFEKVDLGNIATFPFYTLDLNKLPNNENEKGNFTNSLICIDYLKLEHELVVQIPKNHKLVALGVFRDRKIDGCSGLLLNNEKIGINGYGYFLETLEQNVTGDFNMSPLTGEDEVRDMMGRGTSKGVFTYCYIVDFLLFNPETSIEFTSANRKAYKIDLSSFMSLANKLLSISKKQTDFPKISPKSVDKLRDLALSVEKNDLELSRDLMLLAHLARPNGPLIKKKLEEYEKALAIKAN